MCLLDLNARHHTRVRVECQLLNITAVNVACRYWAAFGLERSANLAEIGAVGRAIVDAAI